MYTSNPMKVPTDCIESPKVKKFTDLSKKRQAKLIKHFMSEFCMTKKEATKDCRSLDSDDLADHLDACENGYI